MVTVGFTGCDGGKLGSLVRYQLHVPCFDMAIVESIHMSVMHYIVTVLCQRRRTEGTSRLEWPNQQITEVEAKEASSAKVPELTF